MICQNQIEIRTNKALEEYYSGTKIVEIFQDKQDFIWISSGAGTSRYDGNRLIQLKPDQLKLYQFSDSVIYGASSSGLHIINPATMLYDVVKFDSVSGFYSSYNDIYSITNGPANTIFLGTTKGLIKYSSDTTVFYKSLNFSGPIANLVTDRFKNIWIQCRDFSIYWLNPRTDEFKSFNQLANILNKSEQQNISNIDGIDMLLKQDVLYLSAQNGLLSAEVDQTGKLNQIREHRIDEENFIPIDIFDLFEDEIVIRANAGGNKFYTGQFYRVSRQNSQVTADPFLNLRFPENQAAYIRRDKSGLIWLAGLNGLKTIGLIEQFSTVSDVPENSFSVSLTDSLIRFVHDRSAYSINVNSLDHHTIYYTHTKDDGAVWKIITRSDGSEFHLMRRGGFEWLSCSESGIIFNDPITLARTPDETQLINELTKLFIMDMVQLNDILLISTPRILYSWNQQSHAISKFTKTNSTLSDFVVSIAVQDSIAWLLEHNGNLLIYNENMNRIFRPVTRITDSFRPVTEKNINTITIDNNGISWLSLKNGGLLKTVLRNDSLTLLKFFSIEQLNIKNIVNTICIDSNLLWYDDHYTIGSLNLDSYQTKMFYNVNRYFNHKIIDLFVVDRQRILLKTETQLILMDHDKIMSKSSSAIRISGIYLANNETANLTFIPSAQNNHVDLDYSSNTITIQFALLNYNRPDDTGYEYRLSGLSDNWFNIGSKADITFAGLEPGDYEFEVRGRDLFNRETAEQAKISMAVHVRFWQSLAFKISIVVLFLLFVLYIAYLKWMKIVEITRLKTQIAANLHDDLGSSLAKISFFADVLKNNHDEFSIDIIKNTSNEVIHTLDDLVWSIDARNDVIQYLSNRLKYHLIESCRAKHINYSFNEEIEDPKQNLNSQVRENIYLIFKEAINNSVKHSQADHLSLDIKARKNGIKLVLIDNGVKKEAKQSLRKANGLENMKLRSKQIGAALTIDMDAGTRVELTMSMN